MSVAAIDGGEVAETTSETREYEVKPSGKFFSKTFTILEKDWPQTVISTNKFWHGYNLFDWRAHYTVKDEQSGKIVAEAIKNYGLTPRGIWNGSFLGLFKSATLSDFDVYDGNGTYIGFIDGKVLDLSKARFDFQDANGTTKAYARAEKTQIYIRDTKTDGVVGYMKRIFDTGTEDLWKLIVNKGIDERLAKIFAAFVVQNQSYFLKGEYQW